MIWNGNLGFQDWLAHTFGASFHDFAGSVVVHAMGGWIALAAVILLGARHGRYKMMAGLLHIRPLQFLFGLGFMDSDCRLVWF